MWVSISDACLNDEQEMKNDLPKFIERVIKELKPQRCKGAKIQIFT
jgi:hypothetical protein